MICLNYWKSNIYETKSYFGATKGEFEAQHNNLKKSINIIYIFIYSYIYIYYIYIYIYIYTVIYIYIYIYIYVQD